METLLDCCLVFLMSSLYFVGYGQSTGTYKHTIPYGYTDEIKCEGIDDKIRVKDITTMTYGIPCWRSECTKYARHISNMCNGHQICHVDFSIKCDWSFNPKASLFYFCNEKQSFPCNFEYDFCNWNQKGFERVAPPTTSSTYFPIYFGKYVASLIHYPGFIQSPILSIEQPVCISFIYKSRLAVTIQLHWMNENKTEEVAKFGPYIDWKLERQTLPLRDNLYSVKFTFIRDPSTQTIQMEAAIDNIQLHNSACEDIIVLMNFEDGLSSQRPEIVYKDSSVLYWRIDKASDYFGIIRPRKDHTLLSGKCMENGHYITLENMLVDISRHVSRFEIPIAKEMDDQWCISFWYNMNGANVESLQIMVHTQYYNTTNIIAKITHTDEPDDIWINHFVPIKYSQVNKVLFDGILTGTHSSISVDDILITRGSCIVNEIHVLYQHDYECTDATGRQKNTLLCDTKDIVDGAIDIVLPVFSTLCETNKDAIETELAQYCSESYKTQQCSVYNLDELIMNHTMCTSSRVNQNHPIVMEMQYECIDELISASTPHSMTVEATMSTKVSQEIHDLSSASSGTIIGAICGVIIVAVAIIAAVFVTKRTNILQKLQSRTGAKDNTLKMHDVLSNERGAHLQYCDILKREDNDEHVYNTPIDEKGTENNSKNRVSEANDRAEYAVIKEIDINDRLPQRKENKISSNPSVNGNTDYAVLDPNETGLERKCKNQEGYKRSGDTNFKPFENDQSNDYAVLDPNETGYEKNGKNQEGTKCSDEEKHDYGTLDPNEEEALSPNENKYVKNNDYGILDPDETGYNRSGSGNNGDTTLNEDMVSQGISESVSQDYSVLDPIETGFNRTNQTEKVSETGFNRTNQTEKVSETGFKPIVATKTTAFNALDDYTVLDPNATGFCRTPDVINQTVFGPDKGQTQPISNPYELAKPFELENTNAREDINENNRPQPTNDDEANIYSHCVEDVYDVSSHVRKKGERDSTYGYSPDEKN